ncbi:MAG TPA: class I SAM-dependent methyltransferase [Terriglobia bacterium]|nr:class I SAM-dependent methyltransferase [Terriglobia bacterium]
MAPFKLVLSPQNPNTRSRCEAIFEEGGHWEKNAGRRQTRRFAECASQRFHIPWPQFSLLDVGCALGDAMPVWREKYPSAKLYGCDVAEQAVRRSRECYGALADFFRASFEEIEGFWDVIYCSNVLEHFEQHAEIAELLLAHCNLLLVVAPFGELKDGSPLRPGRDDYYHVGTFYRDTFDFLAAGNKASRVETVIFGCPGGGWGITRRRRIRWVLGTLLRGRYLVQEPLQILYVIRGVRCPGFDFVRDEGRYPR